MRNQRISFLALSGLMEDAEKIRHNGMHRNTAASLISYSDRSSAKSGRRTGVLLRSRDDDLALLQGPGKLRNFLCLVVHLDCRSFSSRDRADALREACRGSSVVTS